MALNQQRTWLVAYDISHPKRLARIHRYLKTEGVPIQYSVFFVRASAAQIGKIRGILAGLINDKADDVRIYQIPEKPVVSFLGTSPLPDGIQLLVGAAPFTFDDRRGTFKE